MEYFIHIAFKILIFGTLFFKALQQMWRLKFCNPKQ